MRARCRSDRLPKVPELRERMALVFPFLLAAVVPLAGLMLAVLRATERRYAEAGSLAVAAVLGTVIWVLLLTA